MKKILYTLLLGVFVLGSCSDFLDKESFTDPSPEYISDEATLIALVNGAYQPLQRPKLYNMRIWSLDIMAGNSEVGAGGGDDGIETIQLSNFVTASDNAAVIDIWRGPNPGILYCNTVLKNAPKMKNVSEEIRNRSIGEAKFLRAHYYFILVQLFGDVPLMTFVLNAQIKASFIMI